MQKLESFVLPTLQENNDQMGNSKREEVTAKPREGTPGRKPAPLLWASRDAGVLRSPFLAVAAFQVKALNSKVSKGEYQDFVCAHCGVHLGPVYAKLSCQKWSMHAYLKFGLVASNLRAGWESNRWEAWLRVAAKKDWKATPKIHSP